MALITLEIAKSHTVDRRVRDLHESLCGENYYYQDRKIGQARKKNNIKLPDFLITLLFCSTVFLRDAKRTYPNLQN